MKFEKITDFLKSKWVRSGLGAPIVILALLGMVTVPMPPFLLDVFFTFNIVLSLIVLMVTIYTRKVLDFAVFPTIILLATLLRLSLNIASTRVILLEGHSGPGAAGKVIQAFGEFVIGGNYAVGIIIFVILIVINFVVITKGAGRVAEVSARFTLDSMPGKQMAIDADLNAGLIDQEQAQERRHEVTSEADFHGSMDGASKFVRGDAIASIIILVVTLIGGLVIGVVQQGLSFSQATEIYTLLMIGDGLVAQIPALLLSTATAIIITRVSGDTGDMGSQVKEQMFSSPQVLAVTAGVIGAIGIIPGMPNLAFLSFAAIAGGGAYFISRNQKKVEEEEQLSFETAAEEEPQSTDLDWDDVQSVDALGLEVGYRLIPLVDKNQDGQLLERIRGVRRKISQELGFLVSPVHIKDNLDLKPNQYRIMLMGVPIAEGEVVADRDLAINPGNISNTIEGIPTIDPTFGLEAVWIEPDKQDKAQAFGYTVVDSSTVIATHISQIVQDYSSELLGFDEVQHLLDKLKESSPKLVSETIPEKVSLASLVKVLQSLLAEKVSIKNIRTIIESLSESAPQVKDTASLVANVRSSLGRSIVQEIVGMDGELKVITLDPSLEQILLQATQGAPDGQLAIEPGLAERLHTTLKEESQKLEVEGQVAVVLVAPQIRAQLAKLFRYSLPGVYVLAYSEVPDNRRISVVASIGNG